MATQALILAAGRGTRLGPNSKGVPKALLQVGRRTLIEHQLATLSSADVGPVAMVVGYCAYEIQDFLGPQVEYLHNVHWASTNSLYSFLQAKDWVRGDLMILNCDILVDPEIVERLLDHGGDCLAYDSGSGTGREQMKVEVVDGVVRGMSKTLDPERVSGENVGILYLKHGTVREMLAAGEALVGEGDRTHWIGAALDRISERRPIQAVDVAGLPWGEIDYSYDLVNARRKVWPSIVRRARRKRPLARILRLAAWPATVLVLAFLLASVISERRAVNTEWETLSVAGAPRVEIEVRDIPQEWYQLDGSEAVLHARIHGPAALRIESRFVLPSGASEPISYALGIRRSDAAEKWITSSTEASGSAHHEAMIIGKRQREVIELPEGVHDVEVRVVAPTDARCLVRLREASEAVDE